MKFSTMPIFRMQMVALLTALVTTTLCFATSSHAQSSNSSTSANASVFSAIINYFADWFPRVTRIQSEQPHWVTPVVTVTPRLEEEYRYDQSWQANQKGVATDNFGNGKGLELIPFQNTEIILGVPNWVAHNGAIQHGKDVKTDGWADETFLAKYRILSANEENGNYILTAFMGFSAPTGTSGNTARHFEFTPTIAFGKGWGDFDFQSTVGVTFPNGGSKRIGTPVAWNTAFQYRLFKYFWPEVETNYTWFPSGEHEGKSQLFLTPGLIIGRFPIWERVGVTFGAGFQVCVTKYNMYHNAWVLTARIPF